MPRPSSASHDLHVAGPLRSSARKLRTAGTDDASSRSRVAVNRTAPQPSPMLSRDDRHVRASWRGSSGRCELIVRLVASDLQVKQCTWLDSGGVLDEVFVLHSRAEFERWHAASTTKFDHPVAHEELRRFAHAHLTP